MKSEILQITSIAYGGDGIARGSDGKICFVPGALPGEEIEAATQVEKKRFNRAKLVKVIRSSAHRTVPECPEYAADRCPGCAYLHCSYEFELSCKHEQLHSFLVRKSLLEADALLPPFASPSRFGCRNKLVMHRSGCTSGYVSKDNITVFPVKKCLLARPELNELLAANQVEYERETFRFTAKDGALKVNGCQIRYLTENIPGAGEFKVAPDGFFQTNIPVAAEIVRRVTEEIANSGSSNLVELYCGTGIFSIAAAEKISDLRCTGVEFSAAAVAAAKINAADHNVSGQCCFIAGDAGKILRKLQPEYPHIMVVDPPRAGLDETALKAIIDAAPVKLIYISCAPDTLSRDLTVLCRNGYTVKNAGVLDMFPGTAHFETIAVLNKI